MQGILNRIEQDPNTSIHTTTTIKGVTYRIGTYHDEPILIFATGMSIANAAMTMQMALDYFPVKQVVYMGIAGAVNPKWQPGDVIVPARWYYHDESVYTNEDPNAPGNTYCLNIMQSSLKSKMNAALKILTHQNISPFTSFILTKCLL